MEPLQSNDNPFGGTEVDPASVSDDPRGFGEQLADALRLWRKKGIKVVWVDLDIRRSAHIPVAVDAGFVFHHAREDGVVMTCRLEEGAFVPPSATHYIGAGGVVIRDNALLLVVSERYRYHDGRRHLKLPGGALHPGEHIVDAVRREIREETGIETRFRSLVCFRHWHGYRYGKSDIYFVCRLDPLSTELSCQDDEIEECLWIPVEEYLAHPDVHAFNRRIVRAALAADGVVPESIDGYGRPETHELFLPPDGSGR